MIINIVQLDRERKSRYKLRTIRRIKNRKYPEVIVEDSKLTAKTPLISGKIVFYDQTLAFKAAFIKGNWQIISFPDQLTTIVKQQVSVVGFNLLQTNKLYPYPEHYADEIILNTR